METSREAVAALLDGVRAEVVGLFEAAARLEALRRKVQITTTEAAELLSTTEGALRALRGRGLGPAYVRNGDRVYYRVKDLDDYVSNGRVRTADAR